jgi:flagellar hook-associated protein 1 FlgK
MSQYSQKILNNAKRALTAHQALIGVTGTNINNVNTEGYSRKRIDLEAEISRSNISSRQIGGAVSIGAVRSVVDQYLQRQLITATGEESGALVENEIISRIEELFDITGDIPSIGGNLAEFFTSLNDLRGNPTSLELRANVLQRANDLTESISNTFASLANLQSEVDLRLKDEILTVNDLTAKIADLNGKIKLREVGDNVATDERDKREVLLQQLAERISFNQADNSDGTILVTLDNGFPLVAGSEARRLETTTSPSFATTPLPNSLGGGILSYVVYDYVEGPGQTHIDFTQNLQNGSGSIGALLRTRGYNAPSNTSALQANGVIVEVSSRIEALTRTLLTQFNSTYLGPDENTGALGHQPSSLDLNGNPPSSPFGFFTFPFTGSRDTNLDGLPNDIGTHGIDSYSRFLTVAILNPREIAAARDSNVASGSLSFQPGNAENLQALYALRTQTFTHSAGNFSLVGKLDEVYASALTYVGNQSSTARINQSVAEGELTAIKNRRDEVSGVSLDEEFANLITYQKGYQASARMIKVSEELLSEIIQLL